MEEKQLLEALSLLDRASAKAHLNREEHILVQNAVNLIKHYIEQQRPVEDDKH